jgi:formate dehydrogenase subunit gamma
MSKQSPKRVIPIKLERASSLSDSDRKAVLEACTRLKGLPGALLPILHDVQVALGYLPKDAIPLIASQLNLSRAEALGAAQLEAHAKRALGVDFHGTTADGAVTLEAVYCLGNCALGPSAMLDDRLQGRLTPERFDALVARARQGA